MEQVACTNCGLEYPDEGVPYRCSRCGGLFDYRRWPVFDPAQIDREAAGIWQYRHFLGLPDGSAQIYLGEGSTPFVPGDISGQKVFFKCETQNPTGSFKDRGSSALVSFLVSRGCEAAIEDSSGNAGASFAAYAARAGLNARIYIPDAASGPKRRQIDAFGAEVVKILGPRSNAAEAALQAANRGLAYGSHAYLPFNLPAYATAAYEMYEQLEAAPGTVVLPAGQGGLLLGVGRGFESLWEARLIKKIPEIVAVQARACAPIWAVYNYGPAGMGWVEEGETVAEGIRVRYPLRGDAVLRFLEKNQGKVLSVEEDQIVRGRDQLAHQGFYVEATSGVVWNAVEQLVGQLVEPVVVVLTGSGLKSTG